MYSQEEIKAVVEKGISTLNLKLDPRELYEPIEYILSIGGKRIRPRLCLTCFSVFSNDLTNSVIYPAIALEVFHAFTLIHDDIMDKADIRRGQKTIHRKWNENVAILSGDVMSIKAYEYMTMAPVDKVQKALKLFSKTAAQICEGQQYDMNYEEDPIIAMPDYLNMVGLKTAVLLACSSSMGAILSGAGEKAEKALYNYGYQLGIAFQITDDYLDVYANPTTFGKNIGGDIVNNKKSWMQVECIRRVQGENKKRFDNIMAMGADKAEEKIRLMTELYEELGVNKAAEEEIDKYYDLAMAEIKDLGLSESNIEILAKFASAIIKRTK